MAVIAAVLLVSILDHAGAFGYRGNDWRNVDRQAFTVTRVIDGDTVIARSAAGGAETAVHLLGVDAPELPDGHWAENAKTYTSNRLLGRTVTLKLDSLEPRRRDGELQAYVYVTDGDCINLDIIHDGQAYADRRVKHSFHAQFEAAESEARKKKRGLWKELADEQMPAWRRQWLRERVQAQEQILRTKKPSD